MLRLKNWLAYQRTFTLAERWNLLGEKMQMKAAWLLPKSVTMWAAVRVGAHATQGEYGDTVVPELTFMDALKRWETA